MKNKIPVIILLFVFSIGILEAQIFNDREMIADTTNPPVIDVIPSTIEVANDTSRFFVKDVSVLNRGGSVLKITKISGSCFCSTGIIIKNNIYSLDAGKIRLEINKDGLDDGNDLVVFLIESNATNSPFSLNVKFVNQDSDSTDIINNEELPKNP